ncbi:hypothetical protein ACJ2A9_16430 [Anaerobacillus sp. MEB173]|uniref:hypothetical protein n=1 Tax=Anaerobacillus sp. MEB173 TaxID=3383345 RepID=UPI003F90E311
MDQQQPNRPNFFDELMFGPSTSSQSKEPQQEYSSNVTNAISNTGQSPTQQPQTQDQNQEVPLQQQNTMNQLDINQMMSQLDINQMMGYINKIGPAIEQISPLLKMLQSFTNSTKK